MDVDFYLREVDRLAGQSSAQGGNAADLLERLRREQLPAYARLLSIRREAMTSVEADATTGYLEIGHFLGLADDDRRAAFLLCFDVERAANRAELRTRFKPYEPTQPLFQTIPALLNQIRDRELINYRCLTHRSQDGEVVSCAGNFGVIDTFVNSAIVNWFAEHCPSAPLHVRLHPFRAYKQKPPSLALEAALRPVNPKWWHQLALHRGQRDGGHFVLDEQERSKARTQSFWDYNVRKVRSLEVSARRDGAGRLTMMVEELSERHIDSGMLIGRCVHLDTADPVGTNAADATMKHLDLAINVYCDDRISLRRDQSLASGKVVDASFRTHLFRVDEVPFTTLFAVPHLFFDSRVLAEEWLDDQFRGWRECLRDS